MKSQLSDSRDRNVAKTDRAAKRLTLTLTILAAAGLVIAMLSLPAVPEFVSDEEFLAKNKIFYFDESPVTSKTQRFNGEEGQMEKGDGKLMMARTADSHYAIKGNSSVGSSPFVGGSGLGYACGAGGMGKRHAGGAVSQGVPFFNTEDYAHIEEGAFATVVDYPLSTFSIDVDTASYANMRRFLSQHRLPPKDSIRIEELINYFSYDYRYPTNNAPFATTVETSICPWNKKHLLSRIGLQAKKMVPAERLNANLVFLIDVSTSMQMPNKLPLLQRSMKMLVGQLRKSDRIAIVVYAGKSGVVLESTPVSNQRKILEAIDALQAGGSTNGGAGIELAYHAAETHFVKSGINRVILATDGDFNVGVTSHGALTRLIELKRKSGVYLSVLGFGMGNYKDATLEQLADKGNGNYAYIDSPKEARKVLVDELGQTLMIIAEDVKIQVEFNPRHVSSYRLIGYENRRLQAQDFNDDQKDAGEIGAGHVVTVLYELVPTAGQEYFQSVDSLRYQTPRQITPRAESNDLYTLKLRYKEPQGTKSKPLAFRVPNDVMSPENVSSDFTFVAAVAGFGMLLRESKSIQNMSFEDIQHLAQSGVGSDPMGYRKEFLKLIDAAHLLAPKIAVQSH